MTSNNTPAEKRKTKNVSHDLFVNEPPIKLQSYVVLSCTFSATLGFDEDAVSHDADQFDVWSSILRDDDNLDEYGVFLKIASKKDAADTLPYSFKIEILGSFVTSDSVQEEKRKELVRNNGASILYTAAREYLLTITGRGPNIALMLPLRSFIPINSEEDRQKKSKRKISSKGGADG